MLYQVTSRRWWSFARTSSRFVLTSALLGLATTSVGILVAGAFEGRSAAAHEAVRLLAGPLLAVAALKVALDAEIFLHLRARGLGELKRTALLLVGELRKLTAGRFGAALAAMVLVAGFTRSGEVSAPLALVLGVASWALFVLGEGIERMLFFRALSAPKMPGAVGP
jgi:DMSO reductase anchor subunit